jgi:hypothetical protein
MSKKSRKDSKKFDMEKVYDLHSPRHNFYGCEEPQSLKDIEALAESMELNMTDFFISDGLNSYEDQHPNKAVIFDVRSEDVIKIED